MTEELVHNTPTSNLSKTYRLAGFWTRLWAFLIDGLVIWALSGIVIKPIFRIAEWSISSPFFSFMFTPYKATLLVVTLLYFTMMTKFFGQTVGKMILGIRVRSLRAEPLTWSSVLFREIIGRFISKMLLFPYLLVVVLPNKQALHDLFADTVVVHEPSSKENEWTVIEEQEQLPNSVVV